MIAGALRAAGALVEAAIHLGRRGTAASLRVVPLARGLAAAADVPRAAPGGPFEPPP